VTWSDADRRALQDVARVAREAAAREGVSPDVAAWLERGADTITMRAPSSRPKRGRPQQRPPASPPPGD